MEANQIDHILKLSHPFIFSVDWHVYLFLENIRKAVKWEYKKSPVIVK